MDKETITKEDYTFSLYFVLMYIIFGNAARAEVAYKSQKSVGLKRFFHSK